jgi:UDP-N-acetylglucosamine 2-epimerase
MKVMIVVGSSLDRLLSLPVSRALHDRHEEVIVFVDGHLDEEISLSPFETSLLRAPEYILSGAAGPAGQHLSEVMLRFEEILQAERPDVLLVRGGANGALAAALAASQVGTRVAHLEAGERCFNRREPEEVHRLVTDHLSHLHLCSSRPALQHLASEGIIGSAYWIGDVVIDYLNWARPLAEGQSDILTRSRLAPQGYVLLCLGRRGNLDDMGRLSKIVDLINRSTERVVVLTHPRLARSLYTLGWTWAARVTLVEALSYFDLIQLEQNARLIVTDSGRVQREAYHVGVPALTLWEETEWSETVDAGWNTIVGVDAERALRAWREMTPPAARPSLFGDGKTSERLAYLLDGDPLQALWEPLEANTLP